jgi:hypothetical protein
LPADDSHGEATWPVSSNCQADIFYRVMGHMA